MFYKTFQLFKIFRIESKSKKINSTEEKKEKNTSKCERRSHDKKARKLD